MDTLNLDATLRVMSYCGWSQHCKNHHNDVDQSSKDGVADQTDIVQPAVNDAESAKEPKKRYETREPKAAAPKPCEPNQPCGVEASQY